MVTRLKVERASLSNDELKLYVSKGNETKSLKDGGVMLVDSEHVSFVYLLEHEDSFVHLSIEQEIWPVVKEALHANALVKLFIDDDNSILLQSFHSELNYLIGNIKGNSNYGDEMVQNVEGIF